MRKYAPLVVVFCGGVAAADPVAESNITPPPAPPEQDPHGISVEIGPMIGRVNVPLPGIAANTLATAEMVHFAPHINLNSFLYFGAGVDIGRLTGNGPSQPALITGAVGQDPGENMGNVSLEGSIAEISAAVGVRGFVSIFSGGGEIAAGYRDMHMENVGTSGGNSLFDTVYQARGRFDVWPSPRFSIGVLAELDVQELHAFSAGLMFGYHFLPYDAAN